MDSGGPAQSEEIANSYPARDCPKRMGWTSENVASDFSLTRDEMDDWAAKSFQRAERAQKAGFFDREIVPFTAFKNDASGARVKVVLTKDDGIRYGTTKESLAKIKAAFPQWGKALTTGGNASQVTDGAAAVLLMTRQKAQELGLTILAKHISTTVTGEYSCIFVLGGTFSPTLGVAPRIMGIGPVSAIKMVISNAGITLNDVDLFEVHKYSRHLKHAAYLTRIQINEAFASQYVYCVKELGIDPEKVNVNGGAIALGHPLDKPASVFSIQIC